MFQTFYDTLPAFPMSSVRLCLLSPRQAARNGCMRRGGGGTCQSQGDSDGRVYPRKGEEFASDRRDPSGRTASTLQIVMEMLPLNGM